MYSIHTTPGFIIESRPHGEAGKTFSIFTRDLGLILAAAQGIRLEKSKLRYHAQEYSFGTFSFVRGKEVWRMTSAATHRGQTLTQITLRSDLCESQELIARIAMLLRRLLHGEEPHPELFDIIEACSRFLEEMPEIDAEKMKALESVVVMRMLHALGYIGKDAELEAYIGSADISEELLESAVNSRTHMNQHINKALRESHL